MNAANSSGRHPAPVGRDSGFALVVGVLALIAVLSAGCSETPVGPQTLTGTSGAPSGSVPDDVPDDVPVDADVSVASYLSGKAAAEAARARSMVLDALERYDRIGYADTVAYYNDELNTEGELSVFVVEPGGEVVAHPDPDRRGLNLNGPLGTDLYGFSFGRALLAADESGIWVTYAYRDALPDLPEGYEDETEALTPAQFEQYEALLEAGALGTRLDIKSTWAVRHDGLIFGSGWYIDDESFIESLTRATAEVLRTQGPDAASAPVRLEAPGSVTAGLQATVDYYNSVDGPAGKAIGFIADGAGTVLTAPYNPELIGTDITELFGPGIVSGATDAGGWMTFVNAGESSESTGATASGRLFVIRVDDYVLAGGWSG